ncbi:hypothetical protein E2562_017175 [Oryza meyeriana var. granulata]|uniref:Uncharacterized protein n=1 Tax=Oryza meyeriana var. granulata TaxID=110450 RepID=A0A6G1EM58_9ORYZ|nr:hypothetical protein E2562_017175 [Oryza meyeriana var. granulata]
MAIGIEADLLWGDAAAMVSAMKQVIALLVNSYDVNRYLDLSIIIVRHVPVGIPNRPAVSRRQARRLEASPIFNGFGLTSLPTGAALLRPPLLQPAPSPGTSSRWRHAVSFPLPPPSSNTPRAGVALCCAGQARPLLGMLTSGTRPLLYDDDAWA